MATQNFADSLISQRFKHVLAAGKFDPAHCVYRHISRAARVVGARFDQGLASAGLTAGQFTILMTLARMGPLSIGRLAEELTLDATTVPRVLRPLVAQGRVQLSSSGDDRRVRLAAISEAGLHTLLAALPVWERLQREALAAVEGQGWTQLRHGMASLRRSLRRAGVPHRAAASGML
jgi:DNA-binding MarR family transcriptional regulator